MTFTAATAVEPIGEGRFKSELDPRWWVARGPHGGYLAAIFVRAFDATVAEAERAPRSLTVHYAAAPREGGVEVTTSGERVGRSATALSARMTQDGRTMANALATYSAAWEGFEFSDAPMPEVKSPEDSFKVPTDGNEVPPFLKNFDMRWAFGDFPFTGSEHAVLGGWFRLDEPEIADDAAVAALMDAWAPAIFPVATEPWFIAPTLDLTIHFRTALPVAGAAAEDYYLGRFSSKLIHEGFFEEDGELWTKDGALIAQSRQLALVLPRKR